tara:strand:- start:592 stop:1014 length:423 start_codon:yes stop_codon:yes gene_type:complete
MKLSKREQKRQQDNPEPEPSVQISVPQEKKSYKKHIIISAILLVVIFAGFGIYSYAKPGHYDDFAKCLTEKGVEMYGAKNWCHYTQAQIGMFGKSFKHLEYAEHEELPGIKVTPTWVINGERYENVQSLQRLSELTGCKL